MKKTGANTPTKTFTRWTSSAAASATLLPQPAETTALTLEWYWLLLADDDLDSDMDKEDGLMEELILAGTAFGEYMV